MSDQVLSHVKDTLSKLREEGLLAPQTSDIDDARRHARQLLAAMPAPPEIYWHGKDGRPCACSSCCLGSTRFLSERDLITTEPKALKRRRRGY